MSSAATRARSLANALAVTAPMPLAAPVRTTTRPSKLMHASRACSKRAQSTTTRVDAIARRDVQLSWPWRSVSAEEGRRCPSGCQIRRLLWHPACTKLAASYGEAPGALSPRDGGPAGGGDRHHRLRDEVAECPH